VRIDQNTDFEGNAHVFCKKCQMRVYEAWNEANAITKEQRVAVILMIKSGLL